MTDIFLRQGDATATTIILRDPTQADAGGVTGTLAWTEDEDTVAISSTLTVSGSLSWTETDDTVSIAGTNLVNFALSWTEVDDVISINATVTASGALSWTETDDVVDVQGNIATATPVSGDLSWTEEDDSVSVEGDIAAPYVPVAATPVSGGGSAGIQKKVLEKWVDEVYADLVAKETPKEVAKEAQKIVAPYGKVGKTEVERVDWARFAKEEQRVRALLDLWESQVKALEDDDEEAILAMML